MTNFPNTAKEEWNNFQADIQRNLELNEYQGGLFHWMFDRSFLIIAQFRLLRIWRCSKVPFSVPGFLVERLFEWLLGVHLSSKTKIGPGLVVFHGQGIIINPKARFGRNVTIYARFVWAKGFLVTNAQA